MTPKQEAFVREYLIDLNATQAAIRAGYSEKTAKDIGCQNLAKLNIKTAIDKALSERAERTEIDAEWVLKRLAEEADADIADLYEENGALKSIHDWPKIWRTGLIGGIDVVQEFETVDGKKVAVGSVTKLKISDRIKRIELIGKHVDIQAFLDRQKIDVVDQTLKEFLNELNEEDRGLPSS